MKKLIIKIIISLILIGISIGTFIIVNNINNKRENEANINISLYDINDELISSKDIVAKKDDKLLDVLNNNYKIRTSESIYGAIIYDINEIKTDFKNTYIAIYVDDKYSNVGISGIKIYDGMKISFKEMKVYYS